MACSRWCLSCKKEVGIKDKEVLKAIKYHTSGRPNMTLLEKIIYVADYIEPGRQFPGVEEVRELAKTSLDQALIKSLQNTITFLLKKIKLFIQIRLKHTIL